ncbi:MAG: hypothetical protein LUC83_03065 [Clostridiales bacterium]|nr:hypothetical protein [Clostridiales bacterium]
MSKLTQIMERQNEVIKIQSDIIDDLFALLIQHISAEEADHLPALDKMRQVVDLRAEIGGDDR